MRAVGGRLPDSHDALLDGHACYLARHGRFPGLVAETGACTDGRLYHGVDGALLARLDRFETDLFERRVLQVTSGGRTCAAWVYLLAPAHHHLLGPRRFDAASFERESLPRWLARLGVADGGVG